MLRTAACGRDAARVYDRHRGAWVRLPSLGPSGPPPAAVGDGVPLDRERLRVRALFAALRAQGVVPHGFGEAGDAAMVEELLGAIPSSSRDDESGIGSAAAFDPGLGPATAAPEESLAPDYRLGVAEANCPSARNCGTEDAPDRCDDAQAAIMGSYVQVVRDVAEMGAGRLRRVKKCDLYWGSLFPLPGEEGSTSSFQDGEEVPPPGELAAALRADVYTRLAHVTAFLLACKLAGVRVSLTPFNAGGGADWTVETSEVRELQGASGSRDWAGVVDGRPSHAKRLWLVCSRGWNEWYYNHGGGSKNATAYEQYAISTWPVFAGSQTSAATPDAAFRRECARRKMLGVAAYCDTIGEWMARVHAALLTADSATPEGLHAVVDFVELGNELEVAFENDQGSAASADAALACGSYMAVLAATLRQHVPGMKFRAAEVAWGHQDAALHAVPNDLSANDSASSDQCEHVDNYTDKFLWLRSVPGSGLEATLDAWANLQRAALGDWTVLELLNVAGLADALAWLAACREAGFQWPPLPASSRDLLALDHADLIHEAGFHWHPVHNISRYGAEAVPLYLDQRALVERVDYFRELVVNPLVFDGFRLGISVGEVDFQADYQDRDANGDGSSDAPGAPIYEGTSEYLQGAMLVRLLATLVASGVSHVHWFCHMLPPVKRVANHEFNAWYSSFHQCGLRNESYDAGEYNYGLFATLGAYRRPAWYSYRRLAWLLSIADPARTVLYQSRGVTVIGFRLRGGVSTGPEGERLASGFEPLRWAWLAWQDQYADSICLHPDDPAPAREVTVWLLGATAPSDAVSIPMVPVVAVDSSARDLDTVGYKAASLVTWEGYEIATLHDYYPAVEGLGFAGVAFTLGQADSGSQLWPLCLLTFTGAAEVAVTWT